MSLSWITYPSCNGVVDAKIESIFYIDVRVSLISCVPVDTEVVGLTAAEGENK